MRQNGSLDREAFRRGTSVYLLRQVIPMLPLPLSHGICSLNPEEDRLTISCDMELDPEGRVIQYRIFESVIRSSARLVYEDVSDLLEGKPVTDPALQALEHPLKQMAELAAVLRKRRQEQGSLDFDLDESDIVLDKSGAAVSVGRRDRRIANCMIEEFMLLANQVVAINAVQHHIPIIYRVHGRPDAEKFTVFSDFLRSMRMRIPADKKVTPLMLQQILAQVKGTPIENVVNTLMLRSMQKASYDAECRGHFGLAMPYYCHFTSPIRRYPDLCVHRALKAWLHGGEEWTEWKSQSGRLQDVAESCSQAERRAIELEREVEKIKKAEYMTHHLGECEEGIVSGVTSFGIYVTLPNTVEGMIRLESMTEDIYQLDETQFRLTGIHTGRVFCLGDAIRIRVWQADPARGEIDFILADQSVHRLI